MQGVASEVRASSVAVDLERRSPCCDRHPPSLGMLYCTVEYGAARRCYFCLRTDLRESKQAGTSEMKVYSFQPSTCLLSDGASLMDQLTKRPNRPRQAVALLGATADKRTASFQLPHAGQAWRSVGETLDALGHLQSERSITSNVGHPTSMILLRSTPKGSAGAIVHWQRASRAPSGGVQLGAGAALSWLGC